MLYPLSYGRYLFLEVWSGQQDLNLRPSAPKADALPDCAMPRAILTCESYAAGSRTVKRGSSPSNLERLQNLVREFASRPAQRYSK